MSNLKELDGNIDPKQLDLLKKHFNIIGGMDTLSFDCNNIDVLINLLKTTKKEHYDPTDRYIIVFLDTDFFWHNHSIILNNLLTVWEELDIPFFTLMLYTNHIGIKKQFDEYCQNRPVWDRPTVVESFVNVGTYDPENYQDIDADIESIDMHALCLMGGSSRSHRHATFNTLREFVPNQIAMVISPIKK